MTIQQRKEHLIELGKFLNQFESPASTGKVSYSALFDELDNEIERAVHYNGWFTKENVLFSIKEWSKALRKENLDSWLLPYQFPNTTQKTVAIILAGNIPLVGFHDFISVLISGNNVLVKQSSNDQRLLPVIAKFLILLDAQYEERITFTTGKLEAYDAVIATGSNNTARYFEYYFAGKPSIIRKNRNSVAILTGSETSEQLKVLGEDIFRYFGLGCRNVSKLYVPEGYDFDSFFKAIQPWEELLNHAKYANNYDYNKAVYLMSEFKFLDNGFLVLKEDSSFGSPIATLFYEKFQSEDQLRATLESHRDQLQCIVTSRTQDDHVNFGQTQHPRLWDYADNVDTLNFLEQL